MKFTIKTKLKTSDVISALKDRLIKRSVNINVDDDTITSISTPIPLFSFDRRQFSKDNWIGINPFQYISNIKIVCSTVEKHITKVDIDVSTARAWLWVIFLFSLAIYIFSIDLTAGLIALSFATIMSFLILSVFAKYLLKLEINNSIQKSPNQKNGLD